LDPSPTATVGDQGNDLSDETLARIASTFKGTRKELAAHLQWSERSLYRRLRSIDGVSAP
jgi:hypothetical protein